MPEHVINKIKGALRRQLLYDKLAIAHAATKTLTTAIMLAS